MKRLVFCAVILFLINFAGFSEGMQENISYKPLSSDSNFKDPIVNSDIRLITDSADRKVVLNKLKSDTLYAIEYYDETVINANTQVYWYRTNQNGVYTQFNATVDLKVKAVPKAYTINIANLSFSVTSFENVASANISGFSRSNELVLPSLFKLNKYPVNIYIANKNVNDGTYSVIKYSTNMHVPFFAGEEVLYNSLTDQDYTKFVEIAFSALTKNYVYNYTSGFFSDANSENHRWISSFSGLKTNSQASQIADNLYRRIGELLVEEGSDGTVKLNEENLALHLYKLKNPWIVLYAKFLESHTRQILSAPLSEISNSGTLVDNVEGNKSGAIVESAINYLTDCFDTNNYKQLKTNTNLLKNFRDYLFVSDDQESVWPFTRINKEYEQNLNGDIEYNLLSDSTYIVRTSFKDSTSNYEYYPRDKYPDLPSLKEDLSNKKVIVKAKDNLSVNSLLFVSTDNIAEYEININEVVFENLNYHESTKIKFSLSKKQLGPKSYIYIVNTLGANAASISFLTAKHIKEFSVSSEEIRIDDGFNFLVADNIKQNLIIQSKTQDYITTIIKRKPSTEELNKIFAYTYLFFDDSLNQVSAICESKISTNIGQAKYLTNDGSSVIFNKAMRYSDFGFDIPKTYNYKIYKNLGFCDKNNIPFNTVLSELDYLRKQDSKTTYQLDDSFNYKFSVNPDFLVQRDSYPYKIGANLTGSPTEKIYSSPFLGNKTAGVNAFSFLSGVLYLANVSISKFGSGSDLIQKIRTNYFEKIQDNTRIDKSFETVLKNPSQPQNYFNYMQHFRWSKAAYDSIYQSSIIDRNDIEMNSFLISKFENIKAGDIITGFDGVYKIAICIESYNTTNAYSGVKVVSIDKLSNQVYLGTWSPKNSKYFTNVPENFVIRRFGSFHSQSLTNCAFDLAKQPIFKKFVQFHNAKFESVYSENEQVDLADKPYVDVVDLAGRPQFIGNIELKHVMIDGAVKKINGKTNISKILMYPPKVSTNDSHKNWRYYLIGSDRKFDLATMPIQPKSFYNANYIDYSYENSTIETGNNTKCRLFVLGSGTINTGSNVTNFNFNNAVISNSGTNACLLNFDDGDFIYNNNGKKIRYFGYVIDVDDEASANFNNPSSDKPYTVTQNPEFILQPVLSVYPKKYLVKADSEKTGLNYRLQFQKKYISNLLQYTREDIGIAARYYEKAMLPSLVADSNAFLIKDKTNWIEENSNNLVAVKCKDYKWTFQLPRYDGGKTAPLSMPRLSPVGNSGTLATYYSNFAQRAFIHQRLYNFFSAFAYEDYLTPINKLLSSDNKYQKLKQYLYLTQNYVSDSPGKDYKIEANDLTLVFNNKSSDFIYDKPALISLIYRDIRCIYSENFDLSYNSNNGVIPNDLIEFTGIEDKLSTYDKMFDLRPVDILNLLTYDYVFYLQNMTDIQLKNEITFTCITTFVSLLGPVGNIVSLAMDGVHSLENGENILNAQTYAILAITIAQTNNPISKFGKLLIKIIGNSAAERLKRVKEIYATMRSKNSKVDEVIKKSLNDGIKNEKIAIAAGKGGKWGVNFLRNLRSFQDDLANILSGHGLSIDDFNNLRSKSADLLSDTERQIFKSIRESIPSPTADTLMQKVIPKGDIGKYLDGSYKSIGGYITKAQDVKDLKTYKDIYDSLRLDYKDTKFLLNSDDVLGVIRFKSKTPGKMEIPFSSKMGGVVSDGEPFTGNGFTAAINGRSIPEFKCNGYIDPMGGAELYEITQNGTEKILAVYDDIKQVFVKVGK